MIFECLQEYLSKGLIIVSRAVPVKGSLPVLSNVLITAESGRVRLTATNLENVITYTFGAEIKQEGSLTVPAKMFQEFITNLEPGKLLINAEKNVLNLTSFPKSKAKFNGMSAIEFPEIPTLKENSKYIQIPVKVLNSLVSHTYFSSSSDVTRPVLTGTLINYSGDSISFVTTDGFRLSEKTSKIEGDFEPFSVIVPTKSLSDVSKILSGAEDLVSINFSENDNLLFFSSGEVSVAVRVIDGSFPDYKKIIPTSSVFKANISSQELLNAVKLTNVFSKESSSPIKVEFLSDGIVKVYSSNQDSGENISEFEALIEGENASLSFNSKYLTDFLTNIKSEKLEISSNGGSTPAVFKSPDLENFLHLIVPMKT
jgi:DNA polymerase-3 subunit beta